MADDYLPTAADCRRFSISRNDRRGLPHRGTFNFIFDPISVSIIDATNVNRSRSKARQMVDQFVEESTSLIFPVDLAEYDRYFWDGEPNESNLTLTSLVSEFRSISKRPSFRQSRPSIIVIFHNVKEYREKLKLKPFSAAHCDFVGKNDIRDTISYMIKRLLATCSDRTRVYPHVGELSSRSTVRFILAAVKESMLHKALRDSGLF